MTRDAADLTAVQLDAITIQGLATRDTDLIDRDDPVVAALSAWVEQIDAGIDNAIPFALPRPSGRVASVGGRRGRTGRTALIAGSTVLAMAISGGAAAAMTGDPLAAIRAPLKVLAKVNPFADEGADKTDSRERLPQQTPTRAQANKLLADARRALAQGHPNQAKRLVAEAAALLGDQVSPGQQRAIDQVTQEVADGAGQPGKPASPGVPKGNGPGAKPEPGSGGAGPGAKPEPGSGGSTGTGTSNENSPDNQAKPDSAKPPTDRTPADKPTAAPGNPDQSAVETTASP